MESLERARVEGLPGRVADAGYDVSGPFRDGPAERGLRYVTCPLQLESLHLTTAHEYVVMTLDEPAS